MRYLDVECPRRFHVPHQALNDPFLSGLCKGILRFWRINLNRMDRWTLIFVVKLLTFIIRSQV
jgi:hypothetical protein